MYKKYVLLFCFVLIFFGFFNHKAEASANILISSSTVAANGVTLTATISGGTGTGYGPATGITFLTPKITTNGGAYLPIASSSISGSTLTINLGTIVPQGETVTLNITTSSNLTDSGADTPAGGTITATNNSTKVPSRSVATSTAISYFGRTQNNAGAGNAYTYLQGAGTDMVFVVNATDATADVFDNGSTTGFTVSIDGGTSTAITTAIASNNTLVPLFSGLSAGDHTVDLKTGFGSTLYLYASNTIQAYGGTGAYRAASTTDGAGYGTYLRLSDPSFPQTGNTDNLATTSAGAYYINNAYTSNAYTSNNWQNTRFRVLAKTSTLKLWVYENGVTLDYDIDGVRTGSITLPNIANWGFVTLATGLDATAYHLYSVDAATSAMFVDAVMLVGSNTSFSSSTVPTLPGMGGYGDSITSGTGVQNDSTQDWLYKTAVATGQTPYNRGISGSTVITRGQASTTDITLISPELSKNFILYGTNDIGAANGAAPTSTFSSAYQTMMTNLLASTTNTHEYFIGILPRSTYSTSTVATYNGSGYGIQGSISAVETAHPSYTNRITYIDSSRWNLNGATGTDYTTNYYDGLHPNATGYALIANELIPYASSTGYIVTGPTSGTSSVASSNFTVSIASGATFDGSETVSISDGGNGGLFTPSVGNASSSLVTVTPTASSTSFTFTYTAVSAGTKTLTYSNGQSWTDASSTTFIATSSPITIPTLTTSPATSITTTTAFLNGAITSDGGASSTVRGFNIGTTTSYTASTTHIGTWGVATFGTTTINLLPSTTYHYRSYATNSAGTGYGADQSFTTSALPVTTTSSGGGSAPITAYGGGGGSFTSSANLNSSNSSVCTNGALYNSLTGALCQNTSLISPANPQTPITTQWNFTSNLQLGSIGSEVKLLQQYLNSHSFTVSLTGAGSVDNETDYFGAATKRALIKFQVASHITPAVGYFGPLTRSYINSH